MSNLYDLEKLVEQRQKEIDRAISDADTLRLLDESDSTERVAVQRPLRARFGLMLIRVGSRLAA